MSSEEMTQILSNQTQPHIILLCGIPASGKTTWLRQAQKEFPILTSFKVLSTDDWLDKKAIELNKTHLEIFNDYIGEALEYFVDNLENSIKSRENIILDQTNVTVASRYLNLCCCENYIKTAVFFEVELDEAINRNCSRVRSIPRPVLETYYKKYERPTLDEGFDYVLDSSAFKSL